MSWIESHQSLSRHKKLAGLVSILKVDRLKLIGHLHELWWWGLDNADMDGNLGLVTDEAIAIAACWPERDAKRFVGALVTVRFLDESDDGPVLHNWYEYAGKLNARRATNKDRMQQARDAARAERERARAEHVQRTVQDRVGLPTVPTNQPNQPAANAAIPTEPTADGATTVAACYRQIADAWTKATGTTFAPDVGERFEAYAEKHGLPWVLDAITETGAQGVKRPKYTYAILDAWALDGRPDVPLADDDQPNRFLASKETAERVQREWQARATT